MTAHCLGSCNVVTLMAIDRVSVC